MLLEAEAVVACAAQLDDIVVWGFAFAFGVPTMSVAGFTPPRVGETPSTGETSSGSLNTKEPDTKRHAVASCSASVPQSAAELVASLRRDGVDDECKQAIGQGDLSYLATPDQLPEPKEDFDDSPVKEESEPEQVGTDSSDDDWRPKPR